MKRTVALKLHGTAGHIAALRELQATFASARSIIAAIAVEARTNNRVKLHHLAYYRSLAIPGVGRADGVQCDCIGSAQPQIAPCKRSAVADDRLSRRWRRALRRAHVSTDGRGGIAIFAHSDRNAARNIVKIAARALTATGDVMRPDMAA